MHVYVNEEDSKTVECQDGQERTVGQIQVTPSVWEEFLIDKSLEWDYLPKSTDLEELKVGHIVGIHLAEGRGSQPIPYVVSQVEENPDIDDVSHLITVNNEHAEYINTVGIYRSTYGLAADYSDDKEGRYTTGDGVSISLVPDLILADILDISELRSELVADTL